MLDACMNINSVSAGWGGSVFLCRWGRLELNSDGYWRSISMNKNIYCLYNGSESVKGTPPDFRTWPVQTNVGRQHSITESFHAAVRGGRHLVMWQADDYIFGQWILTSLNFDTVTELLVQSKYLQWTTCPKNLSISEIPRTHIRRLNFNWT